MHWRSAWFAALVFWLVTASAHTGWASQAFSQVPARPATAAGLTAQHAPAPPETSEQKTAHALELVKSNAPALYAFLKQMPKGTDLDSHIAGATYAESYAQFAADSHLCVDVRTMTLVKPPCKEGQVDAAQSLTDPVLYREMIDAWSMRGWRAATESGHDHFHDAFYRFNAAVQGNLGAMLAEVMARAANGNVQYVELMLTPDEGKSITFASKVQWDDNFGHMRDKLLAAGMNDLIAESRRKLDTWESDKDRILNCRDHNRALMRRGCDVTVRYIYPVLRGVSPVQVFSQMLLAFELARQEPRMVAVNLVQPEDWLVSMRDFELHVRMVSFLKEIYPDVHVALNAGELAPGLVPPDGLRSHVRESVELGHADRIVHGVDVMYEEDPHSLLSEMARREIMVAITLTADEMVPGVKGKRHPLSVYLKAGVPVTLSTDAEGILRSEITREYQLAVEHQGLDYLTLKKMVRTGMEHSFLPGASLWTDNHKFISVKECANEKLAAKPAGGACQKFLANSQKARQQWHLEKALADFENGPGSAERPSWQPSNPGR